MKDLVLGSYCNCCVCLLPLGFWPLFCLYFCSFSSPVISLTQSRTPPNVPGARVSQDGVFWLPLVLAWRVSVLCERGSLATGVWLRCSVQKCWCDKRPMPRGHGDEPPRSMFSRAVPPGRAPHHCDALPCTHLFGLHSYGPCLL